MGAPQPAPIQSGHRGMLSHGLALVGYTLLTLLMTWPLAGQLTSAIPGDSFDGWQNYWNQWWIKVALLDWGVNPFHTDLLYHPTGVGLYFHTLNPFNGLTTLPIQLSAGLIPAYNGVVLLSWVLGGYGTMLLSLYVLSRGQGGGLSGPIAGTRLAAFLAGVIFTFAPFHMAHLLGHMQVMSLEWMPFTILALLQAQDRLAAGRPWLKKSLQAGLFLALVGLCDWYFVLYLFLFTGLLLLWRMGQNGIRIWREGAFSPGRMLRALVYPIAPAALAGLVFLILLSPLLLPMVGEALRFNFMVRPTSDLYSLSASLADFLIPNRLHTLFRPASFTWLGNQIAPVSERTISVGYVALGLALAGFWLRRGRALFWLVSASFFLFLALGPALHLGNITQADIPTGNPGPTWTLYGLLNRTIPFMRISRSVSRFAVMVQLCMAVAAALGLSSLLQRPHRPITSPSRYLFPFSLFLILTLAESWVAPFPLSPPDTPAFYTELGRRPESGAVLNLPMNYDRPGYLLYQTVHQRPLTVAYISRDDPRTLTERVPVLQHFRHLGPDILQVDPVQTGLTILRDLDVAFVVLDRYKMPGGEERAYTTALALAIFEGQTPEYEDERLTVFAVPKVEWTQPYLSLGALNWGALTVEGEERRRQILNGEALVHLHHLSMAARLTLHYTSGEAVSLIVDSLDGQILATLPPAPQGNQVEIALPKPRGSGGSAADLAPTATIRLRLLVQPGFADGIQRAATVESIGLTW